MITSAALGVYTGSMTEVFEKDPVPVVSHR